MTAQFVKASALVVLGALTSFTAIAQDAAPEEPAGPTPQEVAAENLNQLLNLVKQGRSRAGAENAEREKRFAANKANQAAELKRAEQERTREEQRSARLEKKFEENELLIAAKQEQLKERLGTLSELFGHLTAASGDLASTIEVSLVSAQYADREGFLKDLIAKMMVLTSCQVLLRLSVFGTKCCVRSPNRARWPSLLQASQPPVVK